MESSFEAILCRAAVAYEPKKPLIIQEIWVDPPKKGEIRIRVISNALCHTDIQTLDGYDPERKFPCILGHEATGIVQSIGQGVTRFQVGDTVISCFTPQCMKKNQVFCQSLEINFCPKLEDTQAQGVMRDGTTRFRNKENKSIYHFMGCSTLSEYTVIAEISAAKINPLADLNRVCMLGCGISTGWGAVLNHCQMQPGKTVAVWGLGDVGLAVIQAAKITGASKIYAIDVNQQKFENAKKLGADVCFKSIEQTIGRDFLIDNEKQGVDYTFDATRNVVVMRQALESCDRGSGKSCVVGVAQSAKEIVTRSFQFIIQDVPKLVNKVALGEWPIDCYVNNKFEVLKDVNKSVDAVRGEGLRAIVQISVGPVLKRGSIRVSESARLEGGLLQSIEHWSASCNGLMNFYIYLPDADISKQRGKPYSALYFLAGLTATHQNAPQKSGFAKYARKHNLAVVFPDTSPRNTNIQGISDDYQFGDSAGYYVDATSSKCKQHFRMFTYITKQLPDLVSQYFHVSRTNISITGFSMGGHGALMSSLKTGQYRSVSAFAPMGNPTKSECYGIKGYKVFFQKPEEEGKEYDVTEILRSKKYHKAPLLLDIAGADQFVQKLKNLHLSNELSQQDYDHIYKVRQGYNHSFWYVSTFIEEHFDFHAKYLKWFQ